MTSLASPETATRTASRDRIAGPPEQAKQAARAEPPAPPAPVTTARWLTVFAVPCAWCPRVYVRLGNFAGLYAAAAADGWRTDGLCHYWSCPACQAKPGWWAPNLPATCPETVARRRANQTRNRQPHPPPNQRVWPRLRP